MIRKLLSSIVLIASISAFAQPDNDTCADAQFIAMGGPEICIPTQGNNIAAGSDSLTPGCANYQGGEVWFTFIVPSSGIAIIETSADTSGNIDTGMAAYVGSCDDLTLLDCNDDGGVGLYSLIELTGLTPGSQMFVAVWEYGGNAEGFFNICAYQPPVCPDIEANTFETDSTSVDYISVTWESFSPGSQFTVEYGPEGFELGTGTQITGITGTDGPPVEVTGLDTFSFYDFYLWAVCDPENATDTIMDTFNTAPGILANDDCETATLLPVNGPNECIPTVGFNDGATDSGVPHPCAFYQGGDVWFSFVAPPGGAVYVETSNAGGFTDGGLALYGGDCAGGLELIDCDDDGGEGLFSLIEAFGLTPGETYYAAVWEFGGNVEGAFNICVYEPPTCPTPGQFSFFVDSVSATDAYIEWDAINIGATYYIEYGPDGFTPGTGMVATGVIGTDGPPAHLPGLDAATVYDYYFQAVCSPGDSTDVLGPYFMQTLETCQSTSVFEIQVDTAGFDFATISWPPYNPGATFVIEYGLEGFTPGTGTVITGTVGVDGPPVTIPGLLISSNYELYLQEACDVDDSTQVAGPFLFETASLPPDNDDLCGAATLIVNDPFMMFNTEGSTPEAGEAEGSCFGVTGTLETVWFEFTAPASGEVTVSTDLADTELHDTHIAIYELTGDCSDLTSLVEIGCDEDGGDEAPFGYTSVEELTGLTEGQNYYIQVDGWAEQDGEFGIRVFEDVISVEEFVSQGFSLFPNPSEGQVTLTSGDMNGLVDIEVIDMNGRTTYVERAVLEATRPVILDLEELEAGIYMVRVLNSEGFSIQRLVIE
ncbi:MAG: T9SS type A sorting domain-containing protein [Flavobacteriales bacterium]|nr:T9SS type A sorting domain-containing protein [Flavobacteriales bacterium]